jgi:hypothetical protein
VVQITGPLIRIMGDRFPWQIKAAILRTLGLLIRCACVWWWRVCTCVCVWVGGEGG